MKFHSTVLFRRGLGILLAAGLGSCLANCSYKNGYEATPCNLPQKVSYKNNVLPILTQNCYRCHSAKYYVISSSGTFNMEDSTKVKYYANPANGQNGTSYLVGNIRHDPGFVAMPYDGGKLSDCDIATIKAWVDAGAPSN